MTYEFSSEITSPGLGVSPVKLSQEPLATEGEATTGPDDEINVKELESADLGGGELPRLELDTRDFPEERLRFELPEW